MHKRHSSESQSRRLHHGDESDWRSDGRSLLCWLVAICVVVPSYGRLSIWYPPGVKTVRGMYVGSVHPSSTFEEPTAGHRKAEVAQAMRFALVFEQGEDAQSFRTAVASRGASDGHPELAYVPFFINGHSSGSGHAVDYAGKLSDRCLASGIVHLTSSGPSNPESNEAFVMFHTGTRDFAEAGLMNGLVAAARGAKWSVTWKTGEHTYGDVEMALLPLFYQSFVTRSVHDWDPAAKTVPTRNVPYEDGYLVFADQSWMTSSGRFERAGSYIGHRYNTLWVPNEYMARAWRAYHSNEKTMALSSPAMRDGRFHASASYGSTIRIAGTGPAESYTVLRIMDGNFVLKEVAPGGQIELLTKDLAPGTHSLHLEADLTDGTTISSRNVTFVVMDAPLETRIISPLESDLPHVGQALRLESVADRRDGTVAEEVEYFVDGQSVGKSTTPPFTVDWTPSAAGARIVHAVGRSSGDEVRSWPIKLTVYEQQVATHILVKPTLATMKPGTTREFTASVRDQYCFEMPGGTVSWSVNGGGSFSGNTFTAQSTPSGERFIVQASLGGVTGKAEVNVTNTIRINFGPRVVALDGYLNDHGATFGDRGNGYSYGWDKGARNTRATRYTVEEWGPYVTHIPMLTQFSPPWNKTWNAYAWEIELPAGTYTVKIGAGDPYSKYTVEQLRSITTLHHNYILAEGQTVINDTAYFEDPKTEGTGEIEVTDGRLTVEGYWKDYIETDQNNFRTNREHSNKLCLVEITPAGEPSAPSTTGIAVSPRQAPRIAPLMRYAPGSLVITGESLGGTLRLVSLDGRTSIRADITGTRRVEVPMTGLAPGVYIAGYRYGAGRTLVRRLVVPR